MNLIINSYKILTLSFKKTNIERQGVKNYVKRVNEDINRKREIVFWIYFLILYKIKDDLEIYDLLYQDYNNEVVDNSGVVQLQGEINVNIKIRGYYLFILDRKDDEEDVSF